MSEISDIVGILESDLDPEEKKKLVERLIATVETRNEILRQDTENRRTITEGVRDLLGSIGGYFGVLGQVERLRELRAGGKLHEIGEGETWKTETQPSSQPSPS